MLGVSGVGKKFTSKQKHEERSPLPRGVTLPHHRGIYGLFGPGRQYVIQDVKTTNHSSEIFKLIVKKHFIHHNRKPIKTITIKNFITF